VPRSARNWLRSPRISLEWLWDSFCFSVGSTKKLALLPDWNLICHPRVYKTFLQSQVVDPEQGEEFRNFVRCGWRIVISPATGHVTLLHPVAGLGRVALVVADFKSIRDG
jgi:hypothetical protein